jgi:putative glycosyltransferase (TIGR04372 family)
LFSKSAFFKTKKTKQLFDLVSLSNEAAFEYSMGNFRNAITKRKEVMEEIYELQGITKNDSYYPPFLGTNWTNRVGHFAFLGIHSQAQELGLINKSRRFLLEHNSVSNFTLFNEFKRFYNLTPVLPAAGWSEFPSLWHLTERLDVIRGLNGFEHIYELYEKVWTRRLAAEKKDSILDGNLLEQEVHLQQIQEYGISLNDKFIVMHIRSFGGNNHLRNSSIESYFSSIKWLNMNNVKVILIGDPGKRIPFEAPNLIDLRNRHQGGSALHPLLIARCIFFLGTNSGPASLPMLFNKATLCTNWTSIGKNTLTSSKGTIYLPKKVSKPNGQSLSLREHLSTRIGYAESNLDVLKSEGLKVTDNTEHEILNSVKEIFQTVANGNSVNLNTALLNKVNRIRTENLAFSWGNFANSYLEENEDWFLD